MTPTCPSQDTLRDYLLDRLPAALRDDLAGHLSACPACLQQVEAMALGAEGSVRPLFSLRALSDQPPLPPGLWQRLRKPPQGTPATHPAGDATTAGEGAAEGAAPAAGQVWDHYELLRLHASGGLGEVWIARDQHLGREVALKLIRPQRAGQRGIRQRFIAEAQLTARLEHPSVVAVHELNHTPQGQLFYVMPLVPGPTLADAIAQYHQTTRVTPEGPLVWRRLLYAFVDVCRAVAFAHAHGIVHRDLKPSNVIWDGEGKVQVLDWGMARFVGQQAADDLDSEGESPHHAGAPLLPLPSPAAGTEHPQHPAAQQALPPQDRPPLTRPGDVLGTLAYAAPEQLAGGRDEIDARSDIYGLGGILYQILTNRPPHEPVPEGKGAGIRRLPWRRPSELAADIPRALEAVVVKALAVRKADRYGTASELASEVERWLAGELPHAYAPGWHERAARWAGRHRRRLLAAAAALIFLGAAAWATTAYRSAQLARLEQRANALATEAAGLAAAGQSAAALERLGQADALLVGVPALAELRAQIQRQIARARLPGEAQRRLERFRMLASRVQVAHAAVQNAGQSQIALEAVEQCEQAFELFGVLSRDGWARGRYLRALSPGEQAEVQQDVDALLVMHYELQHAAKIRGRAQAGLGFHLLREEGVDVRVPVIAEIEPDGPAAAMGLRAGDKILTVDSRSTIGLDTDDVVGRLRGEPGQAIEITVLHPGEDHASTHPGQRSAEGRMGLSVAAVGQISLAWPPGRAGRAPPIASGDLLLSVAGQPPEGPLVPAADKPETSPFASWVRALMEANSSQVRLVAVSRGGGPLKTAVFSFAESERRACRRANILWLAKNMQLLRGAFEAAVGMTDNGSGLRDMLHIQDPNLPLEVLMENYYAEQFLWPRELIREALSLVPAGHGDYMLALYMQGRGEYVHAASLLRRHLRDHPRHADAYRVLGMCLTEANQNQEAILAWTSFLALRPGVAATYLHRGYCWRNLGELNSARADFSQALALDPSLTAAKTALDALKEDEK